MYLEDLIFTNMVSSILLRPSRYITLLSLKLLKLSFFRVINYDGSSPNAVSSVLVLCNLVFSGTKSASFITSAAYRAFMARLSHILTELERIRQFVSYRLAEEVHFNAKYYLERKPPW